MCSARSRWPQMSRRWRICRSRATERIDTFEAGHSYRHAPAFERIHRLLEAGALRDPHLAVFRMAVGQPSSLEAHRRARGGAMYDDLIEPHDRPCCLAVRRSDRRPSLSRAILLPEREISGARHRVDAEDYIVAEWRAGFVRCLVEADLASPSFMQYAEVHASGGSIFGRIVVDDLPTVVHLTGARAGLAAGTQAFIELRNSPMDEQWAAFARELTIGSRLRSIDDDLATSAILDALRLDWAVRTQSTRDHPRTARHRRRQARLAHDDTGRGARRPPGCHPGCRTPGPIPAQLRRARPRATSNGALPRTSGHLTRMPCRPGRRPCAYLAYASADQARRRSDRPGLHLLRHGGVRRARRRYPRPSRHRLRDLHDRSAGGRGRDHAATVAIAPVPTCTGSRPTWTACSSRRSTRPDDHRRCGPGDGAPAGRDRCGDAGNTDGVLSFYVTKNMFTGEGGIVTTNDAALAEKGELLGADGSEQELRPPDLRFQLPDQRAARRDRSRPDRRARPCRRTYGEERQHSPLGWTKSLRIVTPFVREGGRTRIPLSTRSGYGGRIR